MILLGSTKKDGDADKNGKIVPELESVEVFLVHCNFVENDYQHSSNVLFSFAPDKQFGQLINIKQNSLIMMNTVNTEFSHIEVWFTNQSIVDDVRLFECNSIEHKCVYYCMKMEFQKIINFLDTTSGDKDLPRFVTKKWIKVYDQSRASYNVNKEIRIKTSMLKSDLCDYSDTYIAVKGTITAVRPENEKKNKSAAFENNAPFTNCISKINGIKIDNAEDLDVVMPMYDLLEYSQNYRKITGSL